MKPKEDSEILKIIRFRCPICLKEHETVEQAVKCKRKGFFPKLKVGDFVVLSGFTWFNGDKRWVTNPLVRIRANLAHKNCQLNCCTYQFYYVVTEVDGHPDDRHKPRFHLMTAALKSKKGGQSTINYEVHPKPELITDVPEFVKKDSQRFIGEKSGGLIQ